MNRWAAGVLMALLAVAMLGCERKGNPEETAYDPKVDAPPSPMAKVVPDPGLIEDQTIISRSYETARPGAGGGAAPSGTPPTGTPPTDTAPASPSGPGTIPGGPMAASGPSGMPTPPITPTPTPGGATITPAPMAPIPAPPPATPVDAATETAVKAALTKLVAVNPSQQDQMLALFSDADAGVLRFNLGTVNENANAFKSIEALLKKDCGYDFAPLAQELKIDFPLARFDDMKPAEVKVVKMGQDIVAQSPGGKGVAFIKGDTEWKAGIPAFMEPLIDAYSNYYTAVRNFSDTVMLGLQDGSLTKATADAKVPELAKGVQGAVAKYKQVKAAVMGPDVASPPASPAPAAAPAPAAPTAPPTAPPVVPAPPAPKAPAGPSTPIQVPQPAPSLPLVP